MNAADTAHLHDPAGEHDRLPDGWSDVTAGPGDHQEIADFVESTPAPSGRKFPATRAGIAHLFDGAVAGGARVLRDHHASVAGYSVLFAPGGGRTAWNGSLSVAEAAPARVTSFVLARMIERFTRERALPDSRLRVFSSDDDLRTRSALDRLGFRRERSFLGKRRPVGGPDAAPALPDGLTLLDWEQLAQRGLHEAVREAQHETFLEHFGDFAKNEEDWRHLLAAPAFEPRFSFALLDERRERADGLRPPVVAAYAISSNYTDDSSGAREVNGHVDFLGVRRPWRKSGLGTILLAAVCTSAGRLGLPAVSLSVDTENASNAVQLYDALGYLTVSRFSAWAWVE